jgi:isoquinoline 1-oxidoreductase beta subunit
MKTKNETSRRDFIKLSAQATAFLAIGFSGKASNELVKLVNKTALGVEINPYILINELGKVTLYNARPDMGQGTFQALPLLIAEELEVRLDQVDIQMSDGSGKFGSQLSGGSSSIKTRWIPMRTAGAAVKEMLIQTAAKRWNVSESDCYAKEGAVYKKGSSLKFGYGELVEEAAKLPVPAKPRLKTHAEFTQIGKSIPRPDVPSKVDGTAIFGMDVQVPGMLYASLVHSPTIYGKVKSFSGEKSMAVKGVRFVIKTERNFYHGPFPTDAFKAKAKSEAVAVVAESYWAALKGKKLVEVNWSTEGAEATSTDEFFLRANEAAKKEGAEYKDAKVGEVNKAFAISDKVLQAQYQTPFLSHAAMEPVNATVYVQDDQVEVWAPVQGPDALVEELAKYLGIKKERVKINVTFLGGAFGRKAYYDFVLEAAHISKQVNAPVKLIWTREEDMQQGPYRPGMISAMKGGLDEQGNVLGFEHKLVGGSIMTSVFKFDMTGKSDPWAGEGITLEDSPYAFPARRNSFEYVAPNLPMLWWRSVYASTNLFGHESFLDELAHAAKKDPLDVRMSLLEKSPRFIAVLEKLAQISNYRAKRAKGLGIGIAMARSFSSIAAHAFEVEKNGKGVRMKEVFSVIDCGTPVNPDNIIAQVQSNIVYGLTATIKNEIRVVKGQVQNSNFHDYAVLRQGEIPKMTVHVMESTEVPGGVGEPGLPPVAPALCNAIYNLTGKRIRTLPFDIEQIG